ncbi:lyase family protein [Mumia zhuanghuii]|uniref:3-carboxy-cis,cis-muconate cycloisomerase n=1 Tax=Mumia zhuanghuii TaxID=2585211 RepID=A0A5C4MNP2_9ACTN|nr:lyase family protein [Mumia zhuanghuii]TNC33964.1 3-carboxy-cis,cis-muconate cycloisomerase [Mumia zhuanghuii]TNC47448.1 3-carboxy-cis,cis-muconate cycloisomerase [Mumia zhuanghuii]
MAHLLWPGDERAGALVSDAALLAAMVHVEQAWLDALAAEGIAPATADLSRLVDGDDVEEVALAAEGGGNPVLALVGLLRDRVSDPAAASWLHRGLTSQDVLDTALVLCVREALDRVVSELRRQLESLVRLAEAHRDSAMVGRTLTQHAVPTTFGLVAATWLEGLLEAAEEVTRVRAGLPAQLGGAAGTLAASTELARLRGLEDPEAASVRLVRRTAEELGLADVLPWHVRRTPITRLGDALVTCTDAWGHVATDVVLLCRPEVGELAEPVADGRGGSSTMPQKQNPVLSVLIRRAAIAAPALGATLHTAAALAVDQRPDGAWHAEWDTLRTLARRTVVAASQASELLAGLQVDHDRMRLNLDAAGSGVLSERETMRRVLAETRGRTDAAPPSYLGATPLLIDAALTRARTFLESA